MSDYQITIMLETDRPLSDAERGSLLHAIQEAVTVPTIHLRGEDGTVEDTVFATWIPMGAEIDMFPITPNG